MLSEAFTLPPALDSYSLYITTKRYWMPDFEAHILDPDAITLILLHSTSFHKETWEPSLEHLFNLAVQQPEKIKIREAWAMDCPNHGARWNSAKTYYLVLLIIDGSASAQLNELQLTSQEFFHSCKWGSAWLTSRADIYVYPVTCEKYASGIHHFLIHHPKIDFTKRNLVGIGHSLGSVAL